MSWKESLAVVAALAILIGLPLGVFAYQHLSRAVAEAGVKQFDLVAHSPEAGGWSPELITVHKGDTVRLRIAGRDVVHGFAIGGLGIDVGRIVPGEVTTVEFVADQAGRFIYYCNVWCSPFHYRMRGVLEVVDPSAPVEPQSTDAGATSALEGPDIDAPHPAERVPAQKPSAANGRPLSQRVQMPDGVDPQHQSPSDVFLALRGLEAMEPLTDAELWDLVAYLWASSTTPSRLSVGATLYAKNCVGCHGEAGDGNGPGSRSLEHAPTDFTAAETMAGGTGQIYYAKIRRGGMGTGMPYWGTIFTEEETWSVVDYLWTFLFADYP